MVSRETNGFTLVELALVVLLVGILASLAVVRLGNTTAIAKRRAAEADVCSLRNAMVGSDAMAGYLGDMGAIPGFSPALLRVGNLLCATNLFGVGDVRLDADDGFARQGIASASAFTSWDDEANRGWRGPYLSVSAGITTPEGESHLFPHADDIRFDGDSTFAARRFFPSVSHLSLPAEYRNPDGGKRSVYGFATEPAIGDPWGNPYVLQIPPPQAFASPDTVSARTRFRYARFVSAGPDGILSTPCFPVDAATWGEETRRVSRLAGRDARGASARGDDIVLFINRSDVFEEDESIEP